jgi:hypothetical protein
VIYVVCQRAILEVVAATPVLAAGSTANGLITAQVQPAACASQQSHAICVTFGCVFTYFLALQQRFSL